MKIAVEKKPNKKPIITMMEEEMVVKLEEIARENKVSRSHIIRQIIKERIYG